MSPSLSPSLIPNLRPIEAPYDLNVRLAGLSALVYDRPEHSPGRPVSVLVVALKTTKPITYMLGMV
jgi:hypothetical protein